MHMHWDRGGTCFLGEPFCLSRFWNGGDLPEIAAWHLHVARCRRSKKPPCQARRGFPLSQADREITAGPQKRTGRPRVGGWSMDGTTGLVAEPSRPIGMGREGRKKERGRGAAAAGGRLLRPEEREGGRRISTQQKRRSPVCLWCVLRFCLPSSSASGENVEGRKDAASDAVNQRELPHLHKSCSTRE